MYVFKIFHIHILNFTSDFAWDVKSPLRDFYWHKKFHRPLSANGTHKTPLKYK